MSSLTVFPPWGNRYQGPFEKRGIVAYFATRSQNHQVSDVNNRGDGGKVEGVVSAS
jgi:hypothetical protein